MIKQRIIELKQHPYYNELIETLNSLRPIVPAYDFEKGNVEEMKVRSCEQRHHDLLMSIINPK